MKRLRRKALSLTAVLSMLAMPLALAVPAASAYPTTESDHWAGYVAHRLDNGLYTHVEAGWVQPSITQPEWLDADAHMTAIWIGIGGVNTKVFPVQVGTIMATDTNDNFAGTNYRAVFETPDSAGTADNVGAETIPNFTVRAGDEMLAGVDYSNGSFSLFLADRTSGSNWSSLQIPDHNWQRDTAEVIVERPSHPASLVANDLPLSDPNAKPLGLPKYRTLAPFKTVDFKYVDLGVVTKINMVDGGKSFVCMSDPGLDSSHNGYFTATYKEDTSAAC
jgi:hypothetical protein